MTDPKERTDKGVASGATLWHGRFAGGPSEALMRMSASIEFDRRLWSADIEGSRAHVHMLGSVGILDAVDVDAICSALDQVHSEFSSDTFILEATDEDIHTAIERRVTQIAGPVGGRMHTGRSRNDQVATALRLWCRDVVVDVVDQIVGLVEVLERRALEADSQQPPTYLPGYTHLQHAQPVLLSHHLRAHGWALLRDAERLMDASRRMDVSPLGAGALAGSSLPLDTQATANALGFSRPFENSLDAVSDRDFVAEILSAVAILGVHLSRIGEEWVLWTSIEFGFAVLDDAFATGSSMLPQKKNADVAELARGKAGRFIGNLTGLLATLKGLPLAYNRDLQEDKEPLFDSLDQVRLVIAAVGGMIDTARFDTERMASAAGSEALVATDLAEFLVGKGVPFREAHAIVGTIVRRSLDEGVGMRELVEMDSRLGPEAAGLFDAGIAVRMRRSPGSAGPATAGTQRTLLRSMVDDVSARNRR